MSTSTLYLAGAVANGAIFMATVIWTFFEIRRLQRLDKRLALSRKQIITPVSDLGHRSLIHGAGLSAWTFGQVILRAGGVLLPIGVAEREKLTGMLRQAGFEQQDALAFFLSAKLVGAAALGVLAVALSTGSGAVGQHPHLIALAGLAGLVIGGLVPEYLLRARVAGRLRRMSAALPDALDLMVMCLESGLTFERALVTTAVQLDSIEPDLSDEFRLIDAELRLGSDRRTVLQEYYRRTTVDGLRDFAMTLIQGDRYGTPLTQSMKNIAAGERAQRAARVVAQADRLPVLMTMPMLFFVVPGTMVLVAGPAFMSAFRALGALGGGG